MNILWIGEDPESISSSSLIGWPFCKKMARQGYNITYFVVGVFTHPYKRNGVNIIHPIVQDEEAHYGLGSVQNMFNIIYKRVLPDVVIICLNNIKTNEILHQLKKIEYRNIVICTLTNEQPGVNYGDVKIINFEHFSNKKSIEKLISLLEASNQPSTVQIPCENGVNFKGNIWGNGSMSMTMRILAIALDSIGIDVSLENTVIKQHEKCHFIKDTAEISKLNGFIQKKIEPKKYIHIRYSGPQPSEKHLHEGLLDYTIGMKNVAYWSIDYSALGGAGCPSAKLLNELPEQVWVPSLHSKEALVNSGVLERKIKIVPNGYSDNIFKEANNCEITKKKKFTFLHVSNFKFYIRKGIDVLLASYIMTFDKSDDVQLIIHSQNDANISEIYKLINTYKKRYEHNPEIIVKIRPLSHLELANEYHSCDSFVFPSRGESFGLPPLEAMGCRKPIIVTSWGGMLDFCNADNAYLIDYDLVPVDPGECQGWGGGYRANPRIDCLAYLMHHVYLKPADRDKKASFACRDAKNWTWIKAATKAKSILQKL